MALTAHESMVYNALSDSFQQGKRDDTLELEMQSLSTSERAKAVNNLLSKKRLLMLRDNDGTLRYKPVPADEAQLFKGLSREDQVVHDVIKSSGNRGMWTKDLRERSELSQNQVMKSLKTLEKKELIKSVRSVTNKNRKVYMLASLDPSEEVTGGQWYTDEQFDSTFINTLRDASRAVIQRSSCATVDEVYRAVEDSQVVNVELTVEHISQIVRTLHLDGDIELWHDDGNGHFRMPTKHYRPTRFKEVVVIMSLHLAVQKPEKKENPMLGIAPCSVCPVFHECAPGNTISPETCRYIDDWIDF